MAAAYTLIPSRKPPVTLSLQSPTKKPNNSTPSKSLLNLHKRNPNFSTVSSPPLCALPNNNNNISINPKFSSFASIFFPNHPSPSLLDSFLVFFTSLALSSSVFITDVDSASAFVVTTPRRLQEDELATVRLFQENTPSVVYITNLAVRQDAFTLDVLEVPQGSGSGFVWDKNGHIVTNYHVIRGASDLRVTLSDQSTYEAKVVGFDQDKDVALLRIDATKDKLKPIPIGASASLLVGQKVYAIGNPFGLDHMLTTGVIRVCNPPKEIHMEDLYWVIS